MVKPGKILITGAAGFVGVALCRHLKRRKLPFRAVVRQGGTSLPADLQADLVDVVAVPESAKAELWAGLLTGVEVVIHLAARAHRSESGSLAGDRFFRDNLDMTCALAQGAVRAGVRRFIFLSSIKVNGEGVLAPGHRAYSARDRPRPEDAYAVSKWRAEQELERICAFAKGPKLTIIRSPLVYGPGVKANFATLLAWLDRGWPLPVPRAGNRRSLLYIDNLIDLIDYSLLHEQTDGALLFPADEQDYSTAEIATLLARGLGRPLRLCPLPSSLVKFGAALLRRPQSAAKIFGSLQVDRSSVAGLGRQVPQRAKSGLAETAAWWRQVK
ncbi:MAG: NAD-dependent epimerase/dehydratase family protein [Pseudomonadota bacterium]|nr:NAD-dependent epimerase/dehydratase family protein [Pseudomonadota bacterium]